MDLATRTSRWTTGPPSVGTRRQGLRPIVGDLNSFCVWLVCVLGCFSGSAAAQDPSVIDPQKEYNVKGAFLYSFGRYASWPDAAFGGSEEPFVIGVLGSAPLDPILQRISDTKTVHGRRIDVRQFGSVAETGYCHILFVARTVPEEDQKAVIQRLSQSSVLLVGETTGFAQWGGVINFFLEQESVRFEINVNAARERQISIDAKLLRLARPIQEN